MIDVSELELQMIILEAIEDCSTTDYYEISEGGLSNLSMLAAKAVLEYLKEE